MRIVAGIAAAAMLAACGAQSAPKEVQISGQAASGALQKQSQTQAGGPSQVQMDAVRSLVLGAWSCSGVASGLNINALTTYRPDGTFQSGFHVAGEGRDVTFDAEGTWVVSGFTLSQRIAKVNRLAGTIGGAAITQAEATQYSDSLVQQESDPEPINISDKRLTLTDSEGTVTTCVR